MGLSRKSMVWGSGLAGIAVLTGAFVVLFRPRTEAASPRPDVPPAEARAGDENQTPVKTVHPKRESGYAVSVQELATVEPYFRVNLMSRVAGTLKAIHKDIGDRVTKGEVLAEIDVPDLTQEVAQKEAVVNQRLMDLKVARALVKNAESAVEFARHTVEQRKRFVKRSKAAVEFRWKRYQRYVALSKEGEAVKPEIVAEERKAYDAEVGEHKSAEMAVEKAEADVNEALEALNQAKADVEVKQSLVEVARKDRDRAAVLADYAKIYAPFDGFVVRRYADPGDFIQNATTAHTDPILTIARTDIVTVVMRLPDNDAPFVTPDTEAVIQMDDLPGTEIRGKVTRFAPAIRTADRNMRVEVDLFNGTEDEYQRYVLQNLGLFLAPFGTTQPADATVLMAATRQSWKLSSKSNMNAFPLMPHVEGKGLGSRRLMPGMSGYMRLLLQKFKSLYLVPSSAVFSRGGKAYIMVVRDGTAHALPVRVQVNDGNVAKVAIITHAADPKTHEGERVENLTGNEEILVSRQSEVSDGQAVRTTLEQ